MDTPAGPPLSIADDPPPDDRRALWAMARHVFVRWEVMRIAYVAILTVESGMLIARIDGLFEVYDPAPFWIRAVLAAIVANVFYMAGPIVEIYLRWLGIGHSITRYLLWSIGTLFSMWIVQLVLMEVKLFVASELLKPFGQILPGYN